MRRTSLLALVGGTLLAAAMALRACHTPPDSDGARTIVLVTLDTLRRDHVGAYGSSRGLTPRLDEFARTAIRFDDARTPAPLTLPAHATMFSGLPPAVHGARTNTASRVARPASRPFRLLAERFTEAGRCCAAFVSAEPLAPRYGLDQGFATYDAEGVTGGAGSTTYLRRAGANTVSNALAWLGRRAEAEPVFLWVHLFDAHEPHAVDYAADVRTADRAVGALVDGLALARPDAVVLVVADHGEALGDLLEPSHGFLLGESVLRVPMLLRAPGRSAGARSDPADVADVFPTLLALGAIAPPPPPPDVPGTGLDLLAGPAPAQRARVAEALHGHHQHRWAQLSAAIVGPWKVEDRGTGRVRLQRIDAENAPTTDGTPLGAPTVEAMAALDVLRAYRRVENRTEGEPASAPGGYGMGGNVGYFIEPDTNARLPDPYSVITDDATLQRVVGLLARVPPVPPSALEAALVSPIGVLDGRDAGDPALAFWKARLLRALGRHDAAVLAFDRSIALGGPNTEAHLLAARSERALLRYDALLRRVDAVRRALRPDARLETEAAEALKALGRGAEAEQALETARRLRTPVPSTSVPGPCR